jgi:wobble nucleotide-excising tRNase
MLKKINFIQNIGRFETAKSMQNAGFGPCTLIFGENGWGKSTLTDILRSLTTDNPAIIVGRTTLATNSPPRAVLHFDNQNAVFRNGSWGGIRPSIAIYDSTFVNENVFSGDMVSSDHLKAQYGLVVGEEGIRHVRRMTMQRFWVIRPRKPVLRS